MGNMNTAGIFAAIFLTYNVTAACANDEAWEKTIASADFGAIVSILESNKDVWPHLPSKKWLEARGEPTTWNDLASVVLEKMAEYDAAMVAANVYDVVAVYSTATQEFRERGGYSNYVLSNTAEILALSHLSAYLIENPHEHASVKEALRAFPPDSITSEHMRNIVENEVGTTFLEDEFASWSLPDLLNGLGLNMRDFMNRGGLPATTTRNLLESNDIAGLLWRVITSASTIRIHLHGYIALLERGGQYTDHMIADTTEWNKIMGPVERQYGYPELGINSVRPSYIGPWIKACSEGHEHTPYYALAFH